MMASRPSERSRRIKLFAEELLKCLLVDSSISWNPGWGFRIEPSVLIDGVSIELLPDLNVCRGLISKCVSIVTRRNRSTVVKEVSYILNFTSDKGLLLKSLIFVGEKNDCFFTFMAIAKDICIRFYSTGKSDLIVQVLETVVHCMEVLGVHNPEQFREKAVGFLEQNGQN